jgi:phosphohistidine phosphatase
MLSDSPLKKLVLMRHAKARLAAQDETDFARPLSRSGRETAPRMAAWLAAEGWRTGSVICSAAARTHETAELMAPGLGTTDVQQVASLYLAPPETLLDMIQASAPAIDALLVIGHSPGIAALAFALARGDERLDRNFPPAAAACFECRIAAWHDLVPSRCTLRRFITSAELDSTAT